MDAKTIGLIVAVVLAVIGFGLTGYYATRTPMVPTMTTTMVSTVTSTVTSTSTMPASTVTVTSTAPASTSTVTTTVTVPSTTTVTSTQTVTTTQVVTSTTTTTMQPNQSMMPELIPVANSTVMVDAAKGATVRLGNIIVIIRPGTYVMTPSGQMLSSYSFSIIDYQVYGLSPVMGNQPVFAFAYAVNGQVSPGYTFVNQEGKPYAVVTIVRMPNTWGSWTWLGFTQETNGTLIGGHYAFQDEWVYAGSGLFVNFQFVKPVPWVFVNTGMPASSMVMYTTPTMPNSTEVTAMAPELIPVGIGTLAVNGSMGGAVAVGNLLAIILPGTFVKTPSGQILKMYNFSLVYQAIMNIPPLNESDTYYWPLFSYAFAVNNQINVGYTFVNASGSPVPVLTVAFLPPWFTSWTWLGYVQLPDGTLMGGKYTFPNPWIPGDDYIVNVVFIKPVPWVFLAVEHGYVNMTMSTTTTTTTSSSGSGYVWGG